MALLRISLLLLFSKLVGSSPVCSTDLGVCLRPLVDTWEHIRNVEDHAANLIFPLPLYRRNSTLVLCEQYDTIRRKCFAENCASSPMITFIKQQLGYFCGALLPLYMKKHDCTSSTLLRERQCLRHLHGMPNPLVSTVRCNSFMDFFNCVEGFLDKKCGHESVVLFAGAIKDVGCTIGGGGQLDEDLKLLNTSLSYTDDALTDFFEANRPANFTDLLTSAETGSQTATSTLSPRPTGLAAGATEAPEAQGSLGMIQAVETKAKSSEIFAESTTERQGNEVKQEETATAGSLEQELSNSSDEMAMATTSNGKMIEEGIIETTTEIVDQPESEIVARENLFQEASSITTEEAGNSTQVTSTPKTFVPESTTEAEEESTTEDSTDTSATCSQEDEDYINACHAHLLRRLAKLSPRDPTTQIRFPLAGVSLREVQHLCKMYDEGNRCAAEQLQKCEAMQMLKLVNSQLEAVCFRIESMFRDYQCMLDTYRQNPKCLEPIRGIVTEEEACKGQQESFDCYTSALSCYQGSLILVREMVRGHGCRVDLKRWLTKPPTTTTTTTSVPTTVGNETIPEAPTSAAPPATESVTTPRNPVALEKKSEKLPKLAIEETAKVIQASNTVTAQPTTVTAPEVPEPLEEPPTTTSTTTPAPWFGTCSPRNRKIARVCMGPLLRTWDGLRKRRLQLRKSQFPIYRYTKTELLELCDGYANSFLCAGHDTIRYCLNDELVSFAQGQLGYQCSPQNLRRFLTHYDCITKVEETSNCRDMFSGEALPSARNTQVCAEIANYTDCMTPLVLKQCQPEGLSEFLRTVLQYGCKNVKLD